MQRWSYGLNGFYKTATLYLEEAQAWVFALEAANDAVCDAFHLLHLPFADWWCWIVHNPLNKWLWKKCIKTKCVNVDWDYIKSIFPEDIKHFDEEDRNGREMEAKGWEKLPEFMPHK